MFLLSFQYLNCLYIEKLFTTIQVFDRLQVLGVTTSYKTVMSVTEELQEDASFRIIGVVVILKLE